MDCREFLDKHALYVDLQCSALEENEMRQHAAACAPCARHDTVVRRSLLLVRNLPAIEPSAEFRSRLEARLRGVATATALPASRTFRVPLGTFAALAASVAVVTWFAADAMRSRVPSEIRLAPVVATLPEIEPSQVATPAFVATVPTGMPIWPAIMIAGQAPLHFVAAELADER